MNEDKFELTKGQQELCDKLKEFLDGPDRIFLVEGPPGTGKTTANRMTLKEYIDTDIRTNAKGASIQVAGITLAHSAKNVLGQYIPNVFTFASAFGMKETFNADGSRTFEFNKYQDSTPVGHYSIPVFVHDEVSQYSVEMRDIMLENTPIFSKIILIGDVAQLPPIERKKNRRAVDADSCVFDMDIPDNCKHTLTEIVRQKEGNPILEITSIIREEILGTKNITRVIDALNKPKMHNGIGFHHLNYGTDLYQHVSDRDDYLDMAVIAFRKKSVEFYNDKIRNFILKNPEEELIENDIVCMNDNYYKWSDTNPNEIEYVLHNSDIYQVQNVHTMNLKHTFKSKKYVVQIYKASIKDHPGKHIIVPTEKGDIELAKNLAEMHKLCSDGLVPWKLFWDYRKRFCNCGYGYAITAYKCQGGTYRTVYVDVNDILLTKPLTTKRKLQTIYTAMTRAREDVYLLKKQKL